MSQYNLNFILFIMSYDFSSIKADKSKRDEFLKLYTPNFSLKIESDGNIQRVPKTLLDINFDNITLEIVNKHHESSKSSKNKNDAILQSKGLTESNINFTKQIMKFINLKLDNDLHYNNLNRIDSKTETNHYVNSYYIPKVKVSIQPKDIKLNQDIIDRFNKALANQDDKNKLKKIYEIYDLYGMFVPTGFCLGGKYNIFVEAKNSQDNNEQLTNFKNDFNFFANEQNIGGKFEKDKINNSKNKIEDLNKKIDIEGGDTNSKNLEEWKKSFTLNNLEIIEYITLQNIYKFCGEEIIKEIEELEQRLKNEEKINEQKNNENILNILNHNMPDIEITIGILGAEKTGKTSIMNRIKDKIFAQNHIDFCYLQQNLTINNENKLIRVKFVDNNTNIIRKCDGFILVYDISEKTSFDKIKDLKTIIDNNSYEILPILLIGNKSDLESKVSIKDAKDLSSKLKLDFGNESSCKDLNDDNLEKNINLIIDKSAKAYINNENKKITKNVTLKEEGKKKKGGCFN